MAGYGRTPPIRFFFVFFTANCVWNRCGQRIASMGCYRHAYQVQMLFVWRKKSSSSSRKAFIQRQTAANGISSAMQYFGHIQLYVSFSVLSSSSSVWLVEIKHSEHIRLIRSWCLGVKIKILLDGDHVNYPIGLGAAQHSNWIAVLSRRFKD